MKKGAKIGGGQDLERDRRRGPNTLCRRRVTVTQSPELKNGRRMQFL